MSTRVPVLQCQVESLHYDYDRREGLLRLPDYNCVDMSGCLALFGVIDPNVARIITIEGATGDSAIYERQGVSSCSVTHGRTKTHHVVEDINALPLTQPRRDGAYNGNLARVDCSTAVD